MPPPRRLTTTTTTFSDHRQEDRQIRQEIVSATRESYGIRYPAVERKKFRSKGSRSLKSGGATSVGSAPDTGSSFFITDGEM